MLITAKLVLKYYAFQKARRSIALGHNPRLIFGYMQQLQLQETSQRAEPHVDNGEASPPPLLVMGEEGRHVETQPCGYMFDNDSWAQIINNTSLVTIDRVWKTDIMLPTGMPHTNSDLCLSFALFKLLRCRFARYELTNTGSTGTLNFFWSLLMEDVEHDRIFGVITDEISFAYDYYYSSLPICYSKCWLPILSISISLLSVIFCTLVAIFSMIRLPRWLQRERPISCFIGFINLFSGKNVLNAYQEQFGRWYLDIVSLFLLLVLTIIAEVRSRLLHLL